jgi:transposase
MHASGEAERFYRALASPALVGIETVGNDQWFVQLLQRLGHEVWVGDAAQIRASYVRKQKTDRRDAGHILKLLIEGRFPRMGFPGRRCGITVSCWFTAISWFRYVHE